MSGRLGDLPLPAEPHRLGQRATFEAPAGLDDHAAFAFGIDLYHGGYLWEAHEVWEGLWRGPLREVREGREARALRGLIQAAAAGLKARSGRPDGVASLVQKSCSELGAAGAELAFAGWRVELHRFARELAVWGEAAASDPALDLPRLDVRRA